MASTTRRAGAPVEPRAARRAPHFRPSHTRGRDAFQLYTSDVDFRVLTSEARVRRSSLEPMGVAGTQAGVRALACADDEPHARRRGVAPPPPLSPY